MATVQAMQPERLGGDIPDVDEIVALAASMGMTMTSEEAPLFHARAIEQLEAMQSFLASPWDGSPPSRPQSDREPGYRPTPAEDPLRAWAWKCCIHERDDGILAGRTVSFKDHIAVAGMPLTFGSSLMAGFRPDFDATVVTRVLDAGATVVGKHTMNSMFGGRGFGGDIGDDDRPLNPHNLDHITGGSSSGSAAAVAAGEVDISFGGDQGGSIRIPASFCGVYGLKPTFGLVSHFGASYGAEPTFDHIGPLAQHPKDLASALEAVAGYDGLDPRQDRSIPDALQVLNTLEDGVAGVRLGVVDDGFRGCDGDVRDIVQSAVDVLAAAGATVTRVALPELLDVAPVARALRTDGMRAIFDVGFFGAFAKTYYPPDLIAAIAGIDRDQVDALAPSTRLTLLVSELSRRRFNGRVYAKAQNARAVFRTAFDRALSAVDALVMPTCLSVAPRYEAPADRLAAIEVDLAGFGDIPRNTQPFSYTGHPALNVPCGRSGQLPVGMQLVGRFLDDALLLRIAQTFESERNG